MLFVQEMEKVRAFMEGGGKMNDEEMNEGEEKAP